MNHLNRFLKVFLMLVMLALPLATPLTTVVASEVELGQSDEHYEDLGDATALVSEEEDEFEEVTIREETDVEEDRVEDALLPLVGLAVRTVREEAQLGVVTRGATFRQGPGSSYAAIGNLVRGAELEILGSSGNWLRFRAGNQTGWLSADRVTQGTRVGIITRGATFRQGPGSSYAAVGNLVRGAELEILGSSGNWLRFRSSNQTGWLSADRVARGTRRGVITRGATFRHGPGSSYDAAGNLVRGAELEILGSSGNWLRFRSGNQTGWLSADRVTQGTRIGFTTMGATFRHGPGSSYDAVGTLVRGVELEILGTSANGNWLRIRVGNQTGWVSAERVTQAARASATTMGATLRHGPGSSYDAAGTLVRGVALEVLGTSANGNWLRIRVGNQTGWISSNRVGDSSHIGRGPYAVNAVSGVTYGAVALRRGAGTNYAVIRTVPNHSTLALLNRSGSWIRVRYRQLQANGHTQVSHYGWMHEDSVRIAPTNSFMVTTHGGTTNARADLRTGAGTNHALIRTLNNGTSVTILRQTGNWLNVRVGSDEGWVREDFINSTTEATTTIRTSLRSGPGNGYREISRMPAGFNGTILRHQGMWVNITIEGQTGWIQLAHVHLRPVRELANASNTISSTTHRINITGETGLRVVVPQRRTIAAGRAFDGWQNVQVQHVAANGNVTNIALNRSWQATFTHNGTTFNLQWEGMLDNLIPGTYERQLVIRRGNTVVGRGNQTVVTR